MIPSTSELPSLITNVFGKTSGMFVASGTCAIEASLELMNLERGSFVVVPSLCCWKVLYAIVRSGLVPLVCPVRDDLSLDLSALEDPRARRAAALIAVHQYGLPTPIREARKLLPKSCLIIEDAAQAWRLESSNGQVGSESTVVVSSFGRGKPFDLGYGGALFFNDQSWKKRFDLRVHSQFGAMSGPIAGSLPAPTLGEWKKAWKKADVAVEVRRLRAVKVKNIASAHGVSRWEPEIGDLPSWARVPVRCASKETRHRFESVLSNAGLAHQSILDQVPSSIPFLRSVLLGPLPDLSHYVLVSGDVNRKQRPGQCLPFV